MRDAIKITGKWYRLPNGYTVGNKLNGDTIYDETGRAVSYMAAPGRGTEPGYMLDRPPEGHKGIYRLPVIDGCDRCGESGPLEQYKNRKVYCCLCMEDIRHAEAHGREIDLWEMLNVE